VLDLPLLVGEGEVDCHAYIPSLGEAAGDRIAWPFRRIILTGRKAVETDVTSGMQQRASGGSRVTCGAAPRRRRQASADSHERAIATARERFVAGEEVGREVRPAILSSWRRSRDRYGVDPLRRRAPAAGDSPEHSLEEAAVLAELGAAASIRPWLDAPAGLIAVADGAGRVVSVAGDRGTVRRGETCNLAAWSAWSEHDGGTSGIGLALEDPGPAAVIGCEHWCEGFHAWSSAAIAVRDPVTGRPLGVLDISCWRRPLPAPALSWLRRAVQRPLAELRRRAERSSAELVAAFERRRRMPAGAVAALDSGGRLVAADAHAERLLGAAAALGRIPPEPPPVLRGLQRLVAQAVERGRLDRSWVGTAELAAPDDDGAVPVALSPVFSGGRVIGVVIAASSRGGETLPVDLPRPRPGGHDRLVGVRANRLVLVSPEEIRFAEADGNDVWLTTDRGRLRARTRGLAHLAAALDDERFLQVHRRFVVNVERVREIEPAFKGAIWLVMDAGPRREVVPVSRRRTPELRRALGI
jgi:hypothetical protein